MLVAARRTRTMVDCRALLSTVTPQQHFGHPEPPQVQILEANGEIAVVAHSESHLAVQYKNDIRKVQIEQGITAAALVECGGDAGSEGDEKEKYLYLIVGSRDSTVFVMNLEDRESVCKEILPGDSVLIDEPHLSPLPEGGVQSIHCYGSNIWVTYGDGTLIRFPSRAVRASEETEILRTMTRYSLPLPPLLTRLPSEVVHIVPLRRAHASPLTPIDHSLAETVEALLYVSEKTDDLIPTLLFYSSQNQFSGRMKAEEPEKADVFKRAKNLLSSAFSYYLGPSTNDEGSPTATASSTSPLHVAHEYHDPPRIIQQCDIHRNGHLLATADNLGRILLFDLETKQVIRIWKGFREGSVFFLDDDSLLIHSRHRNIVEIFKLRHGDRMASFSVEKDAQILVDEQKGTGFLLRSSVPGLSSNQLERIRVQDQIMHFMSPSRDTPLRLQELQQMLSAENSKYSPDEIIEVFSDIDGMTDLAVGLDQLSVTPRIGLDHQKRALEVCRARLDSDKVKRLSETNPVLQILTHKVKYHSQLVRAYEILSEYETSDQYNKRREYEQKLEPHHFCAEAIGWASVHEKVLGQDLPSLSLELTEPMPFSEFVSSCTRNTKPVPSVDTKIDIYFSDSSRIRRSILVHTFRPLLGDAFGYRVTTAILESLGIQRDFSYLASCFGEWFMTLSIQQIGTRGLFAVESPLQRFLRDIAKAQLSPDDGATVPDDCLKCLHEMCADSTDLVRSFCLAAICREVVVDVGSVVEESTYGQVSVRQLDKRWSKLLRKLRVCLLVSLRLKEERLGDSPLTVLTVEAEDFFSVYDWLARDEINLSTDNKVTQHLEHACEGSSFAFDPSLREGDSSKKCQVLQNSCLFGVDDDVPGDETPLLLFMRKFNEPNRLVAHRSLLLAKRWRKKPENMDFLRASMEALRSMSTDSVSYRAIHRGISQELWQTTLAPIYRSRLFGLGDLDDFADESLSPLLQDEAWWTDFSQVALGILDTLGKEYDFSNKEQIDDDTQENMSVSSESTYEESWPPLGRDCILEKLVSRIRSTDKNSYQAHVALVCALMLSSDMESIAACMPCIYDCFQPLSLFNDVPLSLQLNELRTEFIENSVRKIVSSSEENSIQDFGKLGTLEILVCIWEYDPKRMRAQFLSDFYLVGKDSVVDGLLLQSTSVIDSLFFIDRAVELVCVRLDVLIRSVKAMPKKKRHILSLLDPELCDWVQKKAKTSIIYDRKVEIPPLPNTRLLVLRLMPMCAAADVETTLRVRIHSLSVLIGTLVHALENSE